MGKPTKRKAGGTTSARRDGKHSSGEIVVRRSASDRDKRIGAATRKSRVGSRQTRNNGDRRTEKARTGGVEMNKGEDLDDRTGQTEVLTEKGGETGVICRVRNTVLDAKRILLRVSVWTSVLKVGERSYGEKDGKKKDKRGVQINGVDTAELRG